MLDNNNLTQDKKSSNARYEWVIMQVSPGQESHVQANIEEIIKTNSLKKIIKRFYAPETSKNPSSKKKTSKILPGYLAIEAIIEKDLMDIVKEVKGFVRFLGPSVKSDKYSPHILSEKEINDLLDIDSKKSSRGDLYFPGQRVTVLQGPFKSFKGSIVSIDFNNDVCTLEVEILGRKTRIDHNIEHIEIDE